MTDGALALALYGWLLMAIIMAGLWLVQKIRQDASLVDVAWAAGLGIRQLLTLRLRQERRNNGDSPRQILQQFIHRLKPKEPTIGWIGISSPVA